MSILSYFFSMLEILLGTLIGVLLGTISGIIPGVHANTLAGVLLSLQAVLLSVLGPVALAGTLFAALITHTFVDAVPSTFLGIPEADTSLAVLPAHALCLEGNGEDCSTGKCLRDSHRRSGIGSLLFAPPRSPALLRLVDRHSPCRKHRVH